VAIKNKLDVYYTLKVLSNLAKISLEKMKLSLKVGFFLRL